LTLQLSVSNRKALVFPIMCNGYLNIDPATDSAGQRTGLFAHDGAFTIQAIITPYDINGQGWRLTNDNNPVDISGNLYSIKTTPAIQDKEGTKTNFQDHIYFTNSGRNRYNHEMVIFYNNNVALTLTNATTQNQNQPAEYKINFYVYDGAVSSLSTSSAVITAANQFVGSINIRRDNDDEHDPTPFHGKSDISRYRRTNVQVYAHTSGAATFTVTGTAAHFFFEKQNIYVVPRSGGQTVTSIGTVTSVTDTSSSTVTLNTAPQVSGSNVDLNDYILLTDTLKEAPYLINTFHIAATYDPMTGNQKIFLNGRQVASTVNSDKVHFEFSNDASYIGQIPSVQTGGLGSSIGESPYNGTNTQFMGELHEFAITDQFQTNFSNTSTLVPNYRSTLLYYRFEEANL